MSLIVTFSILIAVVCGILAVILAKRIRKRASSYYTGEEVAGFPVTCSLSETGAITHEYENCLFDTALMTDPFTTRVMETIAFDTGTLIGE
jgi:hypothetical protein